MLKTLYGKQRRLIDYPDQKMHNIYIYIYMLCVYILTILYLFYEREYFNLMILIIL